MDSPQRTYFPMFDQDTGPPGELAAPSYAGCWGVSGPVLRLEKSRNPKNLEFLKSKPLAPDNYVSKDECKSCGLYFSTFLLWRQIGVMLN